VQIAIATFRLDDASGLGLPRAPDGPSDAKLRDIDERSPVAGLYVRAERLLAKLVWDAHVRAADAAGVPREDRAAQWRRLRALLAQASLNGCAEGGGACSARGGALSTRGHERYINCVCSLLLFCRDDSDGVARRRCCCCQ
jgi:hypothetical protein